MNINIYTLVKRHTLMDCRNTPVSGIPTKFTKHSVLDLNS